MWYWNDDILVVLLYLRVPSQQHHMSGVRSSLTRAGTFTSLDPRPRVYFTHTMQMLPAQILVLWVQFDQQSIVVVQNYGPGLQLELELELDPE